MKKIAIASDHSGVDLKSKIIENLTNAGIKVINLGTDDDESVDYPDFASKVVEAIIQQEVDVGILICTTGIGMSIAANRSSSIRAALCVNEFMAERARMHNDANILVLGKKITDDIMSLKITHKFLDTKFEGGRHIRRLEKIN